LKMTRVIAQETSKATATVMANADEKLLSDTSKHADEIECKTAKTVNPSTLASSTSCDNENEEQNEQIKIDLVDIKKQLVLLCKIITVLLE
ncbi:1505_t:CDS:2, partial [Gigaspora rosea]